MEVTKEKGEDTAVQDSTLLWTLPSIMLFLEKQLSCADVAVVHQSAASLLQARNRRMLYCAAFMRCYHAAVLELLRDDGKVMERFGSTVTGMVLLQGDASIAESP